MSFRYFAYGSNLWPPQLRSRCPSAAIVAPAWLDGWALVFDKPSTDGSAKANLRSRPGSRVPGVIYELDDAERERLDAAEPMYTPIEVEVDGGHALAYVYGGPPAEGACYDWYLALVGAGRELHGLTTQDLGNVGAIEDPTCPGVTPAGAERLELMQSIAGRALEDASRYSVHPGDLAWWVHHADPRLAPTDSYWVCRDEGVIVIDGRNREVTVIAMPGVDRLPLIEWAQRRLARAGIVGWVSDEDTELRTALAAEGYEPEHAYVSFRWDLEHTAVPRAELPPGWELRPVSGEDEANARREASHRAFRSTMGAEAHLERYLRFMRSPVYVPERDLVAVSPEGRIAAFTVWWSDPTGIAQIEPFGTHPDFEGSGVGRALIHFALARMREEGMVQARVITEEERPAVGFYEAVGFDVVSLVRWWGLPGRDHRENKSHVPVDAP